MDAYIHQVLVRMENDGASFNYGVCYPSACQNGNGAYIILDFLDFLVYVVVTYHRLDIERFGRAHLSASTV